MKTRVSRLAVTALGLAVLVWWPRAAPPPATPRDALPALDTLMRVELAQGDVRWALARADGGWRVEPSGDALDAGAAALLREALGRPVPLAPVAAAPDEDPSRFGVGPGSLRVRLVPRAGDPVAFRLGKTLGGRETFLVIEPGRVVRAGAALRRAFDRPPDAWRERALLPDLRRDDVRRIERRDDRGDGWILERADADAPWRLVEPAGWRVDPGGADAVLTSLGTLRATSFDVPAGQTWPVRLTIERADGPPITLRLARSGPGDPAVAVGDRRARVEPSRLLFLDVPADRLRDARIVPPAWRAPRAVRWRVGPAAGRLVRAGEGWVDAEGRPASVAASALITALPEWRTAGFPTAPAVDPFTEPPFAELWLEAEGAGALRLTIGARYADGPARWLRASDRPTVPLVLPASAVRLLDTLPGAAPR